MDDLQFDPALRHELLLRTGSTTGAPGSAEEAEAPAAGPISVIARLDPANSIVPGLTVVARLGPVVTGRVLPADVVSVRRHPNVRSLKLARQIGPDLAVSVPEVRARPDDLRRTVPGGPPGPPLTGEGVIVAVIDWGADFTHINTRKPDGAGFDGHGSTRYLAIWDQRGGRTPTSPEPYGYGKVHTAAEIDAALATEHPHATLGYDHADIDPRAQGTHGAHVVDIATGNGRAPHSSQGVAPRASLLFVHLRSDDSRPEDTLADSARLGEAVDWCLQFAAGRPIVAHMSLGRTGGSHDPTPLLVRGFDAVLAESSGVALCMSAGNYGDSRMHAAARVEPGATVELPWIVPSAPARDTCELEVWYSGVDRLRATIIRPDGTRLADLALGGEAVVRDGPRLVAAGFHRAHDPNNDANLVNVFLHSAAPAGTYLVRLHGDDVRDGRIDAWIERTSTKSQSRFDESVATSASTTGSLTGGWLPLTVGAYDARSRERTPMHFTSRGPTRDGRSKPELSAPGGAVVAAKSSVPRADGSRITDALVAKSGTSMAAPHVSGTVALMFEAAAPRLLPMALTRWVVIESVQHDPPFADRPDDRYGAGRLDAGRACALTRALVFTPDALVPRTGPPASPAAGQQTRSTAQKGTTMTTTHTHAEDVLEWLSTGTKPTAEQTETESEAAIGQLAVSGTPVLVEPRAPETLEASLDDAVKIALARTTEHTVIIESGSPPAYRVAAFGPPTSLPGPVVADYDGAADVRVISVNGGDRMLLPANPVAPGLRRVDVPGLRSFYGLPPADATRLRNIQADRLASAVPTITRAQARAMAVPELRVRLAASAAAAFPVSGVRRGNPSFDAGGVVNGVSLPVLQVPLREPHCYLPVIAEVEGKLESINAWDSGAGISLGPIQFNVIRGALFRFLWQLWTDDHDLFDRELTTPLHWTMAMHGDHPDLLIARAGATDTLHGRIADEAVNAQYLMTGLPGTTGRDPDYRRRTAAALRNCVAWPHVQEMIIDVSAWWLGPSLATIRAAGIGPLDPARPDRDTFVLTALLLSTAVRFTGCLAPLIAALAQWATPAAKLAHWEQALATLSARCQELRPRLQLQVGHARHVHDQLRRLLGMGSTAEDFDEALDDDWQIEVETVDTTSALPAPATPAAVTGTLLSSTGSTAARKWNAAKHPTDSGVAGADISSRVAVYIDAASASTATAAAGVAGGTAPFDAAGVEGIHQFQASAFVDAGQVDGKAGSSTLDTLGIVLRPRGNPVATKNTVAQARITARAAAVKTATSNEFTSSNWWEGMVNPAWLGRTFTNGIHLVLARRLRQAEAALLAKRAYSGRNGVQLGAAVGITEQHKGARPTASSASMHTFGLAVDIEYSHNPWIISQHADSSDVGTVTKKANATMTAVLNRSSLIVLGEIVDMKVGYLSALASGTTAAAWDDLDRRNTAFRTYLGLAGDAKAAAAFVTAQHAVAGVVHKGESDQDAASRWAAAATADLASLRLGSVTKTNAKGNQESVDRSNFSGRDPLDGFLSLNRDLVIALRDDAGLAWGAVDFGGECGDMMHFDCRRDGVGAVLYPR